MVNNKTYNNVVNTILRVGEFHEQIFTTSVGEKYNPSLGESKGEKSFELMSYLLSTLNKAELPLNTLFSILILVELLLLGP